MSYDFALHGVKRVVDGDTLECFVDVGFRATLRQRVRLFTVDTPERGEPGYEEATDFLVAWCEERAGHLRMTTYVEDSWARWVGDVYDGRTGDTASAALLQAGLGVVWKRK